MIGLDLIKQLNANLDFNSDTLKLLNTKIPIRHEIKGNNTKHSELNITYIIAPRSIQKIQIPVNLKNGHGILSYQNLNKIEIPECLVKVKNNLAFTTALNPSENPIKIQFIENFNIEPIDLNEVNFIDHPGSK